MNIKNRILFIGFNYHEYTRSILEELRRLDYHCVFHDIQPSSILFKSVRRMSRSAYESIINNYHRSIILRHDIDSFDFVVFLQVHQMSRDNVKLLRTRQSQARFILYNWDSVKTHDYRTYIPLFDKVITFDPSDAANLGVDYLPLFATRRYQRLFQNSTPNRSIYFIGNIVNPKRYLAIDAFNNFCQSNNISFECFMSTTVHGYTEMLKAGIYPKGVHFRQIQSHQQDQMINNSFATFDFANHSQSGFTMRVIENLCAGKKIITNNKHIANAPFYSPDRILIFENLDFREVPNFLNTPIVHNKNAFTEYHVQQFAANLIRE